MLFELTNASTTFQKIINDILREYLNKFVIIYLNDILIYFETLKKHVDHVKKMLNNFMKKKLQLKFEKCEFHKQKIKFLKFLMNNKDIKIDSKKIKAIKN